MASNYPSETNSSETESMLSSRPPQPVFYPCDSEPPLQFMCSFGGEILPRRHNANQLCYAGGNTHIFSFTRNISFSSLLTEISDLSGNAEISVKYYLPNEDLVALIFLINDKDVENMIVAYNRSIRNVIPGSAQFLGLFLFPESFSNVISHTNAHRSEHEEVPALLMEQNLTKLEELKQEKTATTAITLESSQPEFKLDDAESNIIGPSHKADTFISPSVKENLSLLELTSLFENMCGIQLDHPNVCEVAQLLLQKCSRIPGAVVVLAGLVRRNLEEASATLLSIMQKAYDLYIEQSLTLAEVTCEMLPSKQVRDCFLYYFEHDFDSSSRVQIIAHWIVEGYLDGFNSLEEAYEKGQDILKELIDCSLLVRHGAEHVNIQFPGYSLAECLYMALETGEGDVEIDNGRLNKYYSTSEWVYIEYPRDNYGNK